MRALLALAVAGVLGGSAPDFAYGAAARQKTKKKRVQRTASNKKARAVKKTPARRTTARARKRQSAKTERSTAKRRITAKSPVVPRRTPRAVVASGPAGQFGVAWRDLQQGNAAAAVTRLREIQSKLPEIADYVAYTLASGEFSLRDYAAVVRDLAPVWKRSLASPLVGEAALLAARARKENGEPAEAAHTLRLYYPQLPQPAGDFLLASSYEASNDPASAAVYYQQVYYHHPATPEAQQASDALARLKTSLGDAYPPVLPQDMFVRADRWVRGGDYRRARAEYESIISRLDGFDRDLARVRLGETDYFAYQTSAAYSYLNALTVSYPEPDAERLYYIAECQRRLEKDEDLLKTVDALGERYPQSPWRLKALISAGNRFLVQNRQEVCDRIYRACYESFSSDPQAEYCHWKLTWSAYLRRKPDAGELLRAHLANYPRSEKASAALYFLGRLAERQDDSRSARAYYDEIVERFPNYYYAGVVEERLKSREFSGASPSPEVEGFLNGVVWPVRRYPQNFEPTAATLERVERSRLLDAAGLEDLAENELRFGARTDGQPQLLAVELAQQFTERGSPSQAIRAVKSMMPGYLSLPLDSAPTEFWRLLYPLPYRATLEQNARQKGLDPFLVAGLIRQESEFNPQAVSRAHAYGLTQILPSTGRSLARKLGPRRFRTSMLFRPEINLRLGTYYLRTVYDACGAQWEQALASYNAGGSRVQMWLGWAKYEEPAEFIESIPFTETRNYVTAVLRNAQIYRRLYGADKRLLPAADDPPASKPAPRKSATKKKPRAYRHEPVFSTRHRQAGRRRG